MTRPARLMSLEEFQAIARDAVAAGIPRLRLFLLGEPLLHPDLPEMIRFAKSIGVPSVEINTNAVALTPELSRELLATGLDEVVFSLDGSDAAGYEAIRVGETTSKWWRTSRPSSASGRKPQVAPASRRRPHHTPAPSSRPS